MDPFSKYIFVYFFAVVLKSACAKMASELKNMGKNISVRQYPKNLVQSMVTYLYTGMYMAIREQMVPNYKI